MSTVSKNRKNVIFSVVSGIVFVLGIYLVINSVSLGGEQLNRMITDLGHSLEQSERNLILDAYIKNMQIVGAGTMFLGGIGILLPTLKTLKQE